MKDCSVAIRPILLLAVFVGAVMPAYAQSEAVELTDQGRQLIVERQYEQALTKLDEAVRADAELPQAHYFRGVALGSLGREREALDAFVRAGELNPGWGDAHRFAALAALTVRDLPVAWDQAIKAHQAGADVAETVNRLLAMEKAPADLDSQLAAARVFVMPLNTDKLAAREDNPWGVDVISGGGARGGIVDPFNSSATKATNVGGQQITQSQSDFFNLLTQTRRSLANSRIFGVVARQEMAQYLLVIEVDRLGDEGQKSLRGYIKLYDPRSGEEVYRRVLELRNIASLAELNADMERYVDYMEDWMRKRTG